MGRLEVDVARGVDRPRRGIGPPLRRQRAELAAERAAEDVVAAEPALGRDDLEGPVGRGHEVGRPLEEQTVPEPRRRLARHRVAYPLARRVGLVGGRPGDEGAEQVGGELRSGSSSGMRHPAQASRAHGHPGDVRRATWLGWRAGPTDVPHQEPCHVDHRCSRRPRNPRFARQPHRRGRGPPRRRRVRPRGRALRRLHRRLRGGRAARRRQALPRQGRAEGRRRRRSDTIGPAVDRPRRRRPAPRRPDDARPRRHAQQGQARRQRDPRRLARHRARPPPSRPACRSSATSAAPTPTCCRCR